MTRRQAALRLRTLARVSHSQSAFEHNLLRGRCANKRCNSRYAAIRVTYDFRDAKKVLKNAERVCVECDRVWGSYHVPDLSEWKNIQRHRITLILRPEKRVLIWVRRGKVHREGDDAYIVDDANYSLLMDAYNEWHKRNDTIEASIARRLAKKREAAERAEAEFAAWYRTRQAEWDARDAAARELGIA